MNKPFMLSPSGKDYLWGGQRLKTEFGKKPDMTPLAESWECSTHPDGPSTVFSGDFAGRSLAEVVKENPGYLGSRHKGLSELPILVKLIDAKEDLSVQVHPDDEYAKEHENGQLGKSEMWYVLDASKDAKLVYGLKQDLSEGEIRTAIEKGDLPKYLQSVAVEKDDVFTVNPGTIHAIGAGCLIAEIQENSNLTYRLYDYDREDKNGEKRPLHVDKAMEVANLKSSSEPRQPIRVLKYEPGVARELLSRCKYFEVYRMLVNTTGNQSVSYRADEISFRVLLCVEGDGRIDFEEDNIIFSKGDCVFIPANSEEMKITGKAIFLDIKG